MLDIYAPCILRPAVKPQLLAGGMRPGAYGRMAEWLKALAC